MSQRKLSERLAGLGIGTGTVSRWLANVSFYKDIMTLEEFDTALTAEKGRMSHVLLQMYVDVHQLGRKQVLDRLRMQLNCPESTISRWIEQVCFSGPPCQPASPPAPPAAPPPPAPSPAPARPPAPPPAPPYVPLSSRSVWTRGQAESCRYFWRTAIPDRVRTNIFRHQSWNHNRTSLIGESGLQDRTVR